MTDLAPIYLLTGEFPPRVGGIADYTARLAEGLQELGLDVTVLVGSGHPVDSAAPVSVQPLRSNVRGWSLLEAIADRIGEGPSVVHIQYQTAAFGMHPAINLLPRWLRWRRPRARSIVTCHDVRVPYLFPKAGPVRAWVTHELIDQSHAAIFSDDGDRQWAGVGPGHALIPIGSGVPVVPWQDHSGHRPRPFRLGYFGFMNATKGVSTLLEAVSDLVRQDRDLRLVLIGDALGAADPTNNATRAAIENEIERLGLGDFVDRTGPLSLHDVSVELQRADALVFPFDDGASYRRSSLTAALVHARPVITTTSPSGANGIPGFESGRSVLLVPPRDTSALASAVAALMDSAELRQRLEAGAGEASQHLRWSRIAAAVRDVYISALEVGG